MFRNLSELYQYRALIASLVGRELKARYRASVLGFLWTFLNPALNMVIFSVVFGWILKQGIPNYPYFLFVGQLAWLNFAASIAGGTTSLADRRDLLTKVRFPAQVLPATVVISNAANFLLSVPLLIALGAYYGDWPTWHILWVLPLLLLQMAFTLVLTYLLAPINVEYRDIQHIVANLITALMFLSGVFWDVDKQFSDPEAKSLFLYANPIAALVVSYRDVVYYHRQPRFEALASVAFITVVLGFVFSSWFESKREEFAEQV